MITQFHSVLRLLDGSINVFYDVLDLLRDYVEDFPIKVYECANLIVRWEINSGYLTFKNKYKNLFGDLLETDNEEVREKVVNLINYVIKFNSHDFADILRDELNLA